MLANLAPLGGNTAFRHSSSRRTRVKFEWARGKILEMLATKSNAEAGGTKSFIVGLTPCLETDAKNPILRLIRLGLPAPTLRREIVTVGG